ncbi:SprT family zinc-dependent metalloprotease [Pelomonas sp. SE-A7]|uniref:M48 family metallopeptidase n=1 Tax=Pelomonas sp. SE-A7 TaxID=3054953 RepID=UPI00259CF071|nr:SprT family zinc-dependent metalloprotease [Pelomonas sp. SE-A7]MDM4767896.1 SprT family zinc-dependent metalloprotease [Pelomonas sp. SE-A7]
MLKKLAGLLQTQLPLFETEAVVPPAPAREAGPAAPRGRQLLLGEHRVGYELRRARRRSIGFVVNPDGLKVSAPRWVTIADIETALVQKQDWILRKLVEQQERRRRLEAARVEWREGGELPYLGRKLILSLQPQLNGVRLLDAQVEGGLQLLAVGLPHAAEAAQIRDAVHGWLQRQAKPLFQARCEHFAAALGVSMKSLRLSSAQTRWGSASADGSVRLNWRLIHYAPATIDYVVAHELAHLREMNHSPRFWAVVRSVLPDFEQAKDLLREESLTAFAD